MCKIHHYLVKIWTRVWSLIFWPILKVKLCFVLDRLCVCKHKKTTLSYRMGQKLSSQTRVHNSPKSDGFYIFHISQGSVATQLRCGGMLVISLLQIFHKMRQWKNFENRSIFHKDMDITLWLTFLGLPCTNLIKQHNITISGHKVVTIKLKKNIFFAKFVEITLQA